MPSPTTIFGELTFNKNIMREKLSKNIFEKMLNTIDKKDPLDQSLAADVAHAMKEWAISHGATHFTHWFQPQRGGTAEKHDAFITFDKNGNIIERFSASQLIQSEPDASSFPSGGMRSTFEARGYTAWDPATPAFLHESENTRTLVIPSVFLSWTGAVLDMKTPLLRSMKALEDTAINLQQLLGKRGVKSINVFAGPEQEYFLFSKELYDTRLDLRVCGRTLFGAAPAKGQQMEDHYFGAIKPRVIRFMEDLDTHLFRLGIPAKTRHNEVSPNQFEIACIYEEANLAIDHNLQLMDIIKNVADQQDLVASLHEKPLAGVNGSGKHLNWSMGDNTGVNYLEPSKSPIKNITFLITIGAILLGVKKYGGLLRASVADAGNDHRLGANEAPPAIISIYLGKYLDGILNDIAGSGKFTEQKMADINLGVQNLPKVAKDTADRNRTSPLAFTGNKFEFRAVGSTHNCSEANTILNMIVAYGFEEIYNSLKSKKGDVKKNAFLVLKDVFTQTKAVRFEGDNYSSSWHAEAKKRGLPNDKNTPQALRRMMNKESIALFKKYKILSKQELESKVEIKLEAYNKIKDIELKTALIITNTQVLPALAEYLGIIAASASSVKACGIKKSSLSEDVLAYDTLYGDIKKAAANMEKIITTCQKEPDLFKEAEILSEKGEESLNKLRTVVDKAETVIMADLWPMATYQDLLLKL